MALTTRPGVRSPFGFNTLSAAAIFPLGRAAMSFTEKWADPSESESSTHLLGWW